MAPRYEPSTELLWDVREIRLQAFHVVGEDPSLSGVQAFAVDSDGQWTILATWDVGPFDGPKATAKIRKEVGRLVEQLLR